MHILILPSYYPTEWDPLSGTYFMDQVLALRKAGINAGVAYFDGRSLRKGMSLPALIHHRFQPVFTEEQHIPTVRVLGWNTLQTIHFHHHDGRQASRPCGEILS